MELEFVGDMTLLRINQATTQEMSMIRSLCTGKVDVFKAKHTKGWDGCITLMWQFNEHWHIPAGCWKRLWDLREPDEKTYRPAYDVKFVNARDFFNHDIDLEDVNAFVQDLQLPFENVDDQTAALHTILRYRMSTHHIATGFGKTCLSYMLAQWTKQMMQGRTLMIVPRIILIEQGFSDVMSYQVNLEDKLKVYGICSGFKNTIAYDSADLVIGTFQSLSSMPDDMFTNFTTVIVDEAHTAKAQSIIDITAKCRNAKLKTGISGTMSYLSSMDKLTVESYLGPQVLTYNARSQIDKGRLPNIAIQPIHVQYDMSYKEKYDRLLEAKQLSRYSREAAENMGAAFKQAEFDFLFSNRQMFNMLLAICKRHTDINHNVLVIFKNRQPCINFFEYANELGRKCHLIMGGINKEIRSGIKQQLENESGWILVASTGTIAMGVSINNLEAAVLCMIEHSAHTALQCVGRMLRRHDNKQATTIIYDVASDISQFGTKFDVRHQQHRLELYRQEQYTINRSITFDINDFNQTT